MGSVNKVILVGNLGRDAELRYTPGGAAVATLNMATTEVWNDKGGQRQEKTEWHRVVLWGKSAESLAEYLTRPASGTTRTATSGTPPKSVAIASCCSAAAAEGVRQSIAAARRWAVTLPHHQRHRSRSLTTTFLSKHWVIG